MGEGVVRIDARGQALTISKDALHRHPHTLLARASDEENLLRDLNADGSAIVLDRDPTLTMLVIKVMETGSLRYFLDYLM